MSDLSDSSDSSNKFAGNRSSRTVRSLFAFPDPSDRIFANIEKIFL